MRRQIFPLVSALLMSLGVAACSPSPAPEAVTPDVPVPPATETAPAPTATEAPTAAPTGGSTPPSTTIVASKDACKSDEDCMPSTCCIATACGAASKAPDCSAVRCRRDCSQPNVDCGGGCFCQNGFCAARLGTTEE